MSRVVIKAHATKKLKENKPSTVVKRPQDQSQTTTNNNKDGWEMSAQEALLVNFVVSEI